MSQSACWHCYDIVSEAASHCPKCNSDEPTIASQRRGKLKNIWDQQDYIEGQLAAMQSIMTSIIAVNGQSDLAIAVLEKYIDSVERDKEPIHNFHQIKGLKRTLGVLTAMKGALPTV